MTRRKTTGLRDRTEELIEAAGSIGALERLAGIPQDVGSRYGFWHPFMHLPAAQALDAGVAELKRRIRA